MTLLREKLLTGRRIALGGAVGDAVTEALRALGAEIEPLHVEQLPEDEDRLGEWARERSPLHALLWAAAPDATLEGAWAAVREVASGAMIEADSPGKLMLIAPRPDAGALAGAARAGLENLVRTLSVEWARYAITTVLIAPSEKTTDEQVAAVACFGLSEAGAYLSGCTLDLGLVA
jgi:NAD(P)-dependent dehydrogenase (short-subunit alcohol dehydrogenase family)